MTKRAMAARALAARLKHAGDRVAGAVAIATLRAVRRTDPDRAARVAGAALRRIGPLLPEHRRGRENLAAAFPEKSAEEREEILLGVWENLGRLAAEFAHLDRLWDWDPERPSAGRIQAAEHAEERFARLRESGKPALVFSAHLGHWELPAVAATKLGLQSAVLYRRPNILSIGEAIREIRAGNMGKLIATGPAALPQVVRALEGGAHVGMLVDQHFDRGVDVIFFGRRCKANPTIARLLQHFDCPLHGTRAVRLPGERFRLDITEAVPVPRDENGRVDIQRTMQAITSEVERWVRETPEQWLWLHRRWR